ncbi:hypothetical protein [Mycobacterium timonense]|nr:hypothetical protein [Mycobacterium timonense]
MLGAAGVAGGSGGRGAAPAGADPRPVGTRSSSCRDPAAAGRAALIRGIHRGVADWPVSAPHTSARTTCPAGPTPATG